MTVAIPAQIGGQPVLILKENVNRRTGDEVIANSAMTAEVIGEFLKSSLGPKGMDKLLVGTVGDITFTKSGVTILSEANVEHPVGKLFVELSKATDKNVGDGTTSAVVFASALIRRGFELIKMGVHPNLVAVGYSKALGVAVDCAEKIAMRIKVDDEELLKKVASTAIMPAIGSDGNLEPLANMAMEVVKSTAEKRGRRFFVDTEQISIVKKVGGNLSDSRLVRGVVVEKEVQHPNMPKVVKDARIALVDFSLEVKKTEISTEIEITSPEHISEIKSRERESVLSKISNITRAGANVLFCQKGIADFVAHKLANEGIMAVSRVKRSDVERLARATGATIINDPEDIVPERLGNAKEVEEVTYGKDKVVIVESGEPVALSIVLRGADEDILDNYERAIKRGVSAVANLYEDPRVVLGGGASILEVSKAVNKAKVKQKGEMQLVFEAYSRALEELVETLVSNCGLNKLKDTAELRTLHHRKNGFVFGVDGLNKKIADVRRTGLYEPFRVFKYWIENATDLASLVLKVDDMILTTKPPEEKGKGERA
jgi:chaperonin GroEL (HSP60 family)